MERQENVSKFDDLFTKFLAFELKEVNCPKMVER